jgi:outer membrane protein OmpA-like peptidoglycan-associated protein/tetratricopeptide (TPR) repeat protein
MRLLKSFFLLLFMCLFALSLSAQAPKGKLKRAKKAMDAFNYQEAIELYLDILNKHDDSEAKMNVAECYRMLRNSDEMEYWYGQVAVLPQAPPINILYYAQALQMNGKFDKAKEWVKQYLEIIPDDTRALFLLKACEEAVVDNLRASGALYDVKPREEINSPADEFGPIMYKEEGQEKLLFVSTRDKVKGTFPTGVVRDNWTNDGFSQLFNIDMKLKDEKTYTYDYENLKFFKDLKKTKRHIGPVSFSKEGNQAYFSASDLDGKAGGEDGALRMKIYKVDKNGKKWSSPQGVTFNDEEYNVMHPSLSADGTMLFFASDMPLGFGGMDLYVCYLENGRWSQPINLGPTINTEGDETFPFIHGDGTEYTLYFTSNGHTGLGGHDIYMAKENFGTWMEPTNLGYPVNSNKDDFSFTINDEKTHGYFASNRNATDEEPSENSGGDDIFSFSKLSVSVEVLVFDKNTEMPLEGAEVYTACTNVESYTTNPDGKAFLEVGLDNPCDFAAEKLGFKPNNVRTKATDIKAGQTIVIQIPLDVERVFDVGGTVIDGYTNLPLKDALVRLKSDCEGEQDEQSVLTDADGYYEFLEIKEDCDFQIIVSKEGFTKGSATFTTKNVDEGEEAILIDLAINCLPGTENCGGGIVPDDCNPTGNTDEMGNTECIDSLGNKNYYDTEGELVYKVSPEGDTTWYKLQEGVPQVLNIYYDFDRANIREDARPRLDSVVAFMNMFPEATLRFTSHTDARGSKGYNRRLSRRRAEAVVRYLITNGIPKRRLKAKGMGETVMVNDCYDGIPCSEAQHQENRRTEFTVVNWDGSGRELKSIHNMNGIIIDPCTNCDNAPNVEEVDEFENFETLPENNNTSDLNTGDNSFMGDDQ